MNLPLQNPEIPSPIIPKKVKKTHPIVRTASNVINNKPTLYTILLALAQLIVLYLVKYIGLCPNKMSEQL